MEALRITRKPLKRKITVTLPASFGDDEVEIIILPIEKKTGEKFDPAPYYGFMKHIEMDTEEEIRMMRDEWERNF